MTTPATTPAATRTRCGNPISRNGIRRTIRSWVRLRRCPRPFRSPDRTSTTSGHTCGRTLRPYAPGSRWSRTRCSVTTPHWPATWRMSRTSVGARCPGTKRRRLSGADHRLGAFGRFPEIDRLGDARRVERQHDLAAQAGRCVRRVQDLLHDAPGLAVGDRRLLAPHAAREVSRLLGEAIVPMLLEHGIGPALGRRRLFDGVAEPHLRVRRERVAHQYVGVGLPLVAEHLDAVVHPAGPVPAALDHPDGAAAEFD